MNIVNYERHLAQGVLRRWRFVPGIMMSSANCFVFHYMRISSRILSLNQGGFEIFQVVSSDAFVCQTRYNEGKDAKIYLPTCC